MPTEQVGGLYQYRQLEQRLPGILQPRYREMPFEAGKYIPTKMDLAPGVYEIVKSIFNEVGDAKILADEAYDIPIVDMSSSEDRYRVLMFASAFSLSFSGDRRNQFARSNNNGYTVNEYDEKLKLASRAIQEKRNRFAAYGELALNAYGALNNPNVTINNSSFNPFSTGTPDELADWFIAELEAVFTNSNNVFFPTAALVPDDLWFKMTRTRIPNSSTTVRDYVMTALSARDQKFEIYPVKECSSAMLEANGIHSNGENKNRMMIYSLDPEVIERHVEMIKLAPPEYIETRSLRKLYPMFGCAAPTIINYPSAVRYTKFTKA